MKLLVIGIDGGTKKIIEGMPMPFTQSLFEKSGSRLLNEDLISRGWAEVLTGCKAEDNKGFYLMPFCDGYEFDRSYTKDVMIAESPNPPLWKMLNDKEKTVGILNVPTTGPADKVNGFIVSGGGGGLNSIGGIPDNMYYPEHVRSCLEENKYIFDIRLPGKSTKISEFISEITEAEKIQRSTFIQLIDGEKPDFGFHCFRMATEIQYLARYEIENIIQARKISNQNDKEYKAESAIHKSLLKYYQSLDDNIKMIFENVHPENYILLADHSTALFENDLNLDVWLKSQSFLKLMSKPEKMASTFKRRLKKKVDSILSRVERTAIRRPVTKFSKSRSLAFGSFYEIGNFACIFINDKKRFGGPVSSDEKSIGKIVDNICANFNSDPVCQKYNLHAKPYRVDFKNSKFYDLFPDIQICKPDTMYSSSKKWKFVCDNENLKPFEDNVKNVRYPHSGIKGSDPLFVFSKELERYIVSDDPNDLRLAYFMIERYFSEKTGA